MIEDPNEVPFSVATRGSFLPQLSGFCTLPKHRSQVLGKLEFFSLFLVMICFLIYNILHNMYTPIKSTYSNLYVMSVSYISDVYMCDVHLGKER